jgi:hypothetical protein
MADTWEWRGVMPWTSKSAKGHTKKASSGQFDAEGRKVRGLGHQRGKCCGC